MTSRKWWAAHDLKFGGALQAIISKTRIPLAMRESTRFMGLTAVRAMPLPTYCSKDLPLGDYSEIDHQEKLLGPLA